MATTPAPRISDRLQTRLDGATTKRERAYLLGLLVSARRSEAKADAAAHATDGRIAPRMINDPDVDADRAEAAAEEASDSEIIEYHLK